MKRVIFLIMVCLCVAAAGIVTAQNQPGNRRILIAYFTMPETNGVDTVSGASRVVVNGTVYGNVENAARFIQQATGGDLFRIRTVQTYPNGQPLREAARQERDENARPRLASRVPNFQSYDIIFLGFPNWYADMPMALYTFLEEYNFEGKTIIPFCLHAGNGMTGIVEKIIQLQPRATVVRDTLAIHRNNIPRTESEVATWLRRIGFAQ